MPQSLDVWSWSPPGFVDGYGLEGSSVLRALLSFYGVALRGNQAADPGTYFPNGDLSEHLTVLQYCRAVSIAGTQATVIAAVPYGQTNASLTFGGGRAEADTSDFGDIILGGAVTLIGPPPL